MKSRILPFLALTLIIVTSLMFTGCVPIHCCVPAPPHIMNNLSVSSKVVAVGSVVTISAVATNPNPTNSSYNVTCFVNSTLIGSKIVKLTPTASQTVSFEYIPNEEGTFNVTISIPQSYILSTSFAAFDIPGGYWVIQYNVVGGRVTLNYSLANTMDMRKEITLKDGAGIVTLYVNQTVLNGSREVILPSAGWQLASMFVDDMSAGLDMYLTIELSRDGTGKLYVEDGIGDVDMSSISTILTNPMQTNTFGDLTKDPAGSILLDAPLRGDAPTSVGVALELPLGLQFTSGNTTNVVHLSKSSFNGATISSNGSPFLKTGPLAVADYVGTAGTITTTGTGDCLGLILLGSPLDLQIEIKLVIEPASIK
jgi:hypothetical protein